MKKTKKPRVLLKVRQQEKIDYTTLIQSLHEIRGNESQNANVTVSIDTVPYNIPVIYSLEQEEKLLAVMKCRLNMINEYLCKTDIGSLSSDWKTIGGDLNDAFCKLREPYPKKS